MYLIQLHKVIFGLALLGVVYGVQSTPRPSPPSGNGGNVQMTQGQTVYPNGPISSDPNNPANSPMQVQPPSSYAMQMMDTLGLTKRARQPIAPIYIPNDLSGKSEEEIMGYVNLLMVQRRKIQNRMTRHMAYWGTLIVILHFFGTYSLVKGSVAGLAWLNNNYRGTINADWMLHQQQLAEFIIEYRRVKKLDGKNFPKSWLVGAPYISMEYSKGHSTKFPIWVDAKGKRIPSNAEIRGNVPMFRNWISRK